VREREMEKGESYIVFLHGVRPSRICLSLSTDRGHLGIPQNDTQLNGTEKVDTEQNDSQQNDSYHNGLLRLIHSSAGRDSLYTD